MANVYGVILVGGKGRRLRPLSTDSRPKPFLSVTKDKSTLFASTLRRLAKVVPLKDVLVVAHRAHASLVRKDFPMIDKDNLLLEPVSRNTGPAIALAALTLKERSEDALMVVTPSDHYITDEAGYVECVNKGLAFVEENEEMLVSLAVEPECPSAEYGYLELEASAFAKASADRRSSKLEAVCKIKRFVEKPDLKKARQFFKNKRHLWNTGAFIFKASTILGSLEKYAPKIKYCLTTPAGMVCEYHKLPDISIDCAVMEKASNICCVRGSYGWCDVGSLGVLKEVLDREGRRLVIEKGRPVRIA